MPLSQRHHQPRDVLMNGSGVTIRPLRGSRANADAAASISASSRTGVAESSGMSRSRGTFEVAQGRRSNMVLPAG
jgi:hypothetical protein